VIDEAHRLSLIRTLGACAGVTIPNQLGVTYNTRLLEIVVEEIAPAIGWRPRPLQHDTA
jgi:hypothetical protein